MKFNTFLTVDLTDSKKHLACVTVAWACPKIDSSAPQIHACRPGYCRCRWKSWPCLKLHALSLSSHFLWVAGGWSWYCPRNVSADKMNYSLLFDWTVSCSSDSHAFSPLSLIFLFDKLTTLYFFQPILYSNNTDSRCYSLGYLIKTRLIPVSSIIYSLWKHDLEALLFVR